MAAQQRMKLIKMLRLLTPQEIATLTKVSTGVKKISLTDLITGKEEFPIDRKIREAQEEKEASEGKPAEVIPFPGNKVEDKRSEEENSVEVNEEEKALHNKKLFKEDGQNSEEEELNDIEIDKTNLSMSKEEAALSAVGIESQTERDEREKREEEIKKKHRKSTSEFILDEKNKLKENSQKLKLREIKKSYDKSSSVDIDLQKESDDLANTGHQGTLVNKKQF